MRRPVFVGGGVLRVWSLFAALPWGKRACERGPVMKDVYARLEEGFGLRGPSDRSRKAYLGAVRQLERHCARPPDELGDGEVRGYFLHLIGLRRVSPSTVNRHLYAIKFLYRITLKRELPCLSTIRPKGRRKLKGGPGRRSQRAVCGAALASSDRRVQLHVIPPSRAPVAARPRPHSRQRAPDPRPIQLCGPLPRTTIPGEVTAVGTNFQSPVRGGFVQPEP